MNQENKIGLGKRIKNYFGRLFQELDKKMEAKAKSRSCCSKPGEKGNKSCCS